MGQIETEELESKKFRLSDLWLPSLNNRIEETRNQETGESPLAKSKASICIRSVYVLAAYVGTFYFLSSPINH